MAKWRRPEVPLLREAVVPRQPTEVRRINSLVAPAVALPGDVAQWLEHLLCTQGVVGSSPIVSTTKGQLRGHTADSEVKT